MEDVDFPIPELPALGGELEAELGKLTPVATRRPLRQLAILVGVSLVYGAGLLALITVRRDFDELPMGWVMAAGCTWLLGFVVPAYLAIVPRKGSVLPRWQLGAVAAGITSVGFVALGLIVHPSGPSSLDYTETFARGHWCLELGLGTAIVPVVAGAIFLRGALPVGSRWTAAALGAGGGALGGLVLHLHCRIADKWHVGIIHGGVVVVAAVLAAALVPRVSSRE
jgi:hypothetical protein